MARRPCTLNASSTWCGPPLRAREGQGSVTAFKSPWWQWQTASGEKPRSRVEIEASFCVVNKQLRRMRRPELNLFVSFFLGTAATRLGMQLSRAGSAASLAPACRGGLSRVTLPSRLVPFLLQQGSQAPLCKSQARILGHSQARGRNHYLFK